MIIIDMKILLILKINYSTRYYIHYKKKLFRDQFLVIK